MYLLSKNYVFIEYCVKYYGIDEICILVIINLCGVILIILVVFIVNIYLRFG